MDNFFTKSYTTEFRFAEIIDAASTVTVWTPISGKRIVLTNLTVASGPGGTIQFFFDGNSRRFEFFAGSSSTITPNIGNMESTLVSQALVARVSGATSGGWRITAQGFEAD